MTRRTYTVIGSDSDGNGIIELRCGTKREALAAARGTWACADVQSVTVESDDKTIEIKAPKKSRSAR